MAGELFSLAEASESLGVSVERVRQLVVAGDLPGRRIGNAWAVPQSAVLARRQHVRGGGRPLRPQRAWHEIVAGHADLSRPGRYQRRANVIRCQMSHADVDAIADAREGGVRGAISLGAGLNAPDEERDVYLPRQAFERLDDFVAYVVDPLGPVRLRVVSDDVWESIPNDGPAPVGAVALDLLDSADPRHWVAAEELVARG